MIRLEPVEAERVADHLDELAAVWQGITEERLRTIIPRHTGRPCFRFLVARSDDGTLAGFTYGYLGGPDQWWHDIVAKAMTEEQRQRWLPPGHFEFVELHVRADLQRRGIGGRLHDALLEGLEGPAAVLSTQVDNGAALSLYRGRGWAVVVPRLHFTPGGTAFCVMGLDLA